MFDFITLSDLRKCLGQSAQRVALTRRRLMITRNGKLLAALMTRQDLEILEEVERKSLQYKEYQMAEAMHKWHALKDEIDRRREE